MQHVFIASVNINIFLTLCCQKPDSFQALHAYGGPEGSKTLQTKKT